MSSPHTLSLFSVENCTHSPLVLFLSLSVLIYEVKRDREMEIKWLSGLAESLRARQS